MPEDSTQSQRGNLSDLGDTPHWGFLDMVGFEFELADVVKGSWLERPAVLGSRSRGASPAAGSLLRPTVEASTKEVGERRPQGRSISLAFLLPGPQRCPLNHSLALGAQACSCPSH